MTHEKKEEIITQYVNWHNSLYEQDLAVLNPFRYGTFALWLEYNFPDEKGNVDELHRYMCASVTPVGVPDFASPFDPWID